MRWLCLVAFAALPVQWVVVAPTPIGVGRLHQVAIIAFAVLFFCRYRPRSISPVWRAVWPFLVANVAMLTLWSVMQLYQGIAPVGPLKEFFYLAVFLAVATFIFRAVAGREGQAVELLRWTAAVAAVTVLVTLSYSLVRNGVSPVKVFGDTIRAGNPEILQKELFKTAFTGFGYDEATVRGNIRHEVFGAVLFGMYVSAWANRYRPLTSRPQQIAYQLSMVLSTSFLLVSLSRSIIIAAAVWPVISLFRAVRTFTLSSRQLVAVALTLILAGVAAVSGFGLVLWNRFTTDTSSYESRQGLYSEAISNVGTHFLTGGVDTSGASSHNFVLDSLLRGGIFVALAAAAVLLWVVLAWLGMLARLHLEPDWMVPVAAALVLPLVRLGTSGGGLINPVEWIALAFVSGILAARLAGLMQRRRPAQPRWSEPEPAPAVDGGARHASHAGQIGG